MGSGTSSSPCKFSLLMSGPTSPCSSPCRLWAGFHRSKFENGYYLRSSFQYLRTSFQGARNQKKLRSSFSSVWPNLLAPLYLTHPEIHLIPSMPSNPLSAPRCYIHLRLQFLYFCPLCFSKCALKWPAGAKNSKIAIVFSPLRVLKCIFKLLGWEEA